eukprot:jgi/Psemu1/318055/estExt_fgenesh1_pm.C_430008
MSAAVVVIPPTSTKFSDASAARKRRREILASQRQAMEAVTITASTKIADYEEVHVKKVRRVSDITDDGNSHAASIVSASDSDTPTRNTTASKKKIATKKKPQMKYDPDVPMSKEEAAAWRREQRRKRNRESAALSRQRQRDRIGDLEIEVDQWKNKVESIMERIKKLEEASGIDSRTLVPEPIQNQAQGLEQSLEFEVTDSSESKFVSPPPSPGHSPLHEEPLASPVASSSAKTVVDAVVDQVLMGIESYEHEFSDNMISRHATSSIPAVKITTVAPALPFLPKSEDSVTSLPTPEACLSGEVVAPQVVVASPAPSNPAVAPSTTLDPIDSSLFPVKEEPKLPNLLSDEENEDEFGEFLLDAVQWL